jgi:hypothetical protein
VTLEELLGRQGRPEIRIVGGDQGHDRPPEAIRESPAAGPTTLARNQAVGAVVDDRRTESLDLADAKTQNPRGLSLRQSTLQNSCDDPEPVQFRMAHGCRPGGHVGELPMPQKATFSRWRNPTFIL